MGMFDYIKCEIQLPGYSFITNEVEGTYRRDYLTDLHGDIRFYNGIPIDGKKYDYFARFSYGKLDRLWMREWDRW